MKFKVGDKVKFLNDTGGGVVSGIIDNKLVNVRIEEGFDVPVLISELVADIDENQLMEKHEEYPVVKDKPVELDAVPVEVNESEISPRNLPEGAFKNIYFGFVPKEESVNYNSDINAYLINDSEFYVFYIIGYQEKDSFYYIKSGMLEANTKEHIRTFSQSEISKIRKFHFQVMFVSRGRYFPQVPVNEYISISSMGLYKESSYKENDFFDRKAVIFEIFSDEFKKEAEKITNSEISRSIADKDKNENIETGKKVKQGKSDIEEVDLHIHEITDNYSNLSEGEILEIQLKRFYSVLEEAINDRNRKIVFIHGIGNGKLKYEIRKALDTKYPGLEYQDASFKDYGFGATLVTI